MARTSMVAKTRRAPKFLVRRRSRCEKCGRPRAYMRRFQLCRLCFRAMALRGLLPGVVKASW